MSEITDNCNALNENMIRGDIVEEKLESGAMRYASRDFPPLAEADLRAVADRIRDRLTSE